MLIEVSREISRGRGGRYHSPVRRPPRIVVLVANPITYDGRVRRHASTLVEAGYDVTVIGVIGPNDRADPPSRAGAPSASGGTGSPPWHYQRIDRRRIGMVPRLRWLQSAARRLAHAAFWGCRAGCQAMRAVSGGAGPGPAGRAFGSDIGARAGLGDAATATADHLCQ